jgi:CDP-paratose 2-epimerase
MKWLLTGGAGFIGTNLACDLAAAGEACLVTDNFHRPGAQLNQTFLAERCGLTVTNLDVRFADRVDQFFQAHPDIDVVAHLAGQVSLVASIADPRYDFDTNALGTFNVLDAARRFAPHAKLIYAGTNKVYGDLAAVRFEETDSRYTAPDYPRGFPETLPVDLHGGYSCSKGSADQYVRDYRKTYGLKTVALRQSSIYGGNQYATEDQGWVAYFVEMGVRNLPFRISGTGKQVRDLLHVSDLCKLFRTIAALPDTSPAWGEAFNIGGGVNLSLSLLELFRTLRRDYGLTIEYTAGAPRTGDQKVFIADTAKALHLLGWSPETSISTGLGEMIVSLRAYARIAPHTGACQSIPS